VNKEFIAAINQVCHDRQLPKEVVIQAVESALESVYRRKYGSTQSIEAKIDPDTGEVKIFTRKLVTDQVTDDKREIGLQHARRLYPQANLGDEVTIEITPEDFGRIAAQNARQMILQRIREAERDSLYNAYVDQKGEILSGTVQSIDPQQVTLSLGKVEAVLPRSEQMPTERYSIGQRLRVLVCEVEKTPRGPMITVSRTHRNMLRRLLELEVPEIYNGSVEIKAVAREAGYRSKVAVNALQEGVDPVGSCVGMRGMRIQSIVNELNGEKIDVVAWSPDPAVLIANSLSPAKVLNVILGEDGADRTATVVVPDKQLSLAIGKEGQNARLAAKLTSWRIDIKSATEAASEALQKVAQNEELRRATARDHDILGIASEILKEKDGTQLSDGELQALSRAIQIVRDAEVSLEKERTAARLRQAIAESLETTETAAPPRPTTERETADDLLSRAEAILAAREAGQLEVPGVAAPAEAEVPSPQPEPPAGEPSPVEMEPAVTGEAVAVEPVAEEALVEELRAPGSEELLPEPVWEEEEEEDEDERPGKKKKGRAKRRDLVFDDTRGELITSRRRKPGRQRGTWQDYY